MWWLAFTAIDLYVGVVLLDMLAKSDAVPAEKHQRLIWAKRITVVLLALTILALLVKAIAGRWV